jgi:hypothetical protein
MKGVIPLSTPPHLQGCLPTGLEWDQQRKTRSEQDERARDVHRHRRGKVCIQRNDWRLVTRQHPRVHRRA